MQGVENDLGEGVLQSLPVASDAQGFAGGFILQLHRGGGMIGPGFLEGLFGGVEGSQW